MMVFNSSTLILYSTLINHLLHDDAVDSSSTMVPTPSVQYGRFNETTKKIPAVIIFASERETVAPKKSEQHTTI
jgi:hypothetical protein